MKKGDSCCNFGPMHTPQEIEKLSNERLEEAIILFQHKKYDGAYYQPVFQNGKDAYEVVSYKG